MARSDQARRSVGLAVPTPVEVVPDGLPEDEFTELKLVTVQTGTRPFPF